MRTSFPEEMVPFMKRLGEDIASARKARKFTMDDLAERMQVDRRTVSNMEKGDPRVSFGAYVVAAWIMGLEKNFVSPFDPLRDPVFQRQARFSQPKVVKREAPEPDGLDF